MYRTLIYSLLLTCMMSTAALAETVYSTVIPDLPLIAGMTEAADHAVVFDKPGGRIVETAATGTAASADIKKFYSEALPPLGWKSNGGDVYLRNGEKLTITAADNSVQFKITPQD